MPTPLRDARISVVVVARNEGSHLRKTVLRLLDTLPDTCEIVIVDDDPCDAGSGLVAGIEGNLHLLQSSHLGVTKARNFGAQHSSGDVIVFADAHIDTPPEWWLPLLELLENESIGAVAPAISVMGTPDVKGYGLTIKAYDLSTRWLRRESSLPYCVPILPGCCLAMRRETFQATGGFDPGLRDWGTSDVELSIRIWLLGLELWVAPNVDVQHLFRPEHPYPVAWRSVLHNKLRTALVHLSDRRVQLVVDALKHHDDFAAALILALHSEWESRRSYMKERRSQEDDWFFQRFVPDL